ncbi:ROK family protein [Coriobacterium glomerans PW2]|uniref:ROK family protein n=1 Tax=Coriobacterium glomerans (strain ATCC 49209 / DSM 20642 / JCM 10262 / PW2) TaxID=700015 RepID=F2NB48_CORGP|nr:ROK family protein [Coriobacterium glomerans]AEB07799.1 ROK family protein [Coriobacterium glomerans PW2]
MDVALGIDIGGTTVKSALVDRTGALIQKRSVRTESSAGHVKMAHDIAAMAKDMSKDLPDRCTVVGAGAGAPGPVEGRMLLGAVNLGWGETPLAQAIERSSGLPTVLLNDANAAALGERWAARSHGGDLAENLLFATLGTGVGGAIIVNGSLLNGAHACGGEIGHIPSGKSEKRVCGCGNLDCLETYASANGLLATANNLFVTNQVSAVPTCEELFERVKAGDRLATKALDDTIDLLARALAGIINTIDPEMVIIGGGLSAAGGTPIR